MLQLRLDFELTTSYLQFVEVSHNFDKLIGKTFLSHDSMSCSIRACYSSAGLGFLHLSMSLGVFASIVRSIDKRQQRFRCTLSMAVSTVHLLVHQEALEHRIDDATEEVDTILLIVLNLSKTTKKMQKDTKVCFKFQNIFWLI